MAASPRRVTATCLRLIGLWVAAGAWCTTVLSAQEASRWNGSSVLTLVRRAQAERNSTVVDSAFRSYRAQARGYVYFFIDRKDNGERTLVKADQVALEVLWHAPNVTRQRIVGLRDKKMLPTNIHYHLDHLTVVQDDFGDHIRLGDGDEVSEVLHPLAPTATDRYDYLLSDSLSIRYGSADQEVRVYEVRVRPRDAQEPGFIGTVYLDRASAAVVRMRFTFTPASYVDSYLDYIRISLDNSLWLGKYWLPYRQEAELRREIPQLDFLAGSVIRGRFEIGDYELNGDVTSEILGPGRVTAVSERRRLAFPFERGLLDDVETEGLAPAPTLDEIRAQARQMLQKEALSGLAPFRLHFGSFSEAFRYDRAEGARFGGGVKLRPDPRIGLGISVGYAAGTGEGSASVSAVGEPASVVPELQAFWNEPRDIGPLPAAASAVGTLGAFVGGEDYLDPYFVRGIRLKLRGPIPDAGPSLTFRWERHASARNEFGDGYRAVRPIEEGILGAIAFDFPFALPGGGTARTSTTLGRIGDHTFASQLGEAHWARPSGENGGWSIRFDANAGATSAEPPPQALYLAGGRGTLPGYDFRSFVGREFWLARAEGTHPLLQPWVGIRIFAALGATYLSDTTEASLPPAWNAHDTDGLRASLGAGLSFGWDVLRLDLAHGLRDGRWELIFAVDPTFHPWL